MHDHYIVNLSVIFVTFESVNVRARTRAYSPAVAHRHTHRDKRMHTHRLSRDLWSMCGRVMHNIGSRVKIIH